MVENIRRKRCFGREGLRRIPSSSPVVSNAVIHRNIHRRSLFENQDTSFERSELLATFRDGLPAGEVLEHPCISQLLDFSSFEILQ